MYSGQLQFFTSSFDLKLLMSRQQIEVRQTYDFDGSAVPLVRFATSPAYSDVRTGELQILSKDTSWGSDWLQWVVGAYYFESTAGFDTLNLRVANTNLAEGLILGRELVPQTIRNAVNRVLEGIPGSLSTPTGEISLVGILDTKSISYYAQSTVALTDTLSLTLGARYQDEDRTLVESSAGLGTSGGRTLEYVHLSADRDPDLADNTSSFSPKIGLDYRPQVSWLSADTLLYTSWQKATKSSTYNVVNFLDMTAEKVEPEKIEAYEIGIKTRFFDNLLSLNAAAFHYRIDNPQVQFISLFAGGVVTFENAGSSRVVGFDFDALMQVFPSLLDGLILTLNGAYLDTEYTSYKNGSGYGEETGFFSQGNDYSGNNIVRSPKVSGTVAILQTLPAPSGTIEIGLDYYYNSGFSYLAQGTPNAEEPSYGVLGAQIGYLYEPWNLRITAFGRNLTGAHYNYSRFITDFGTNDARAPLEQYGLRLQLTYR